MSLCFAAITPHTPLLVPSIGKDKLEKVAQTQQALKTLEQELYLAKPDLLIVISPHGGLYNDAFVVNAHNNLTASFADFGDLVTTKTWKGSPQMAATLSHEGHVKQIPIQLVSNETLDHGASVPLLFLTEHFEDIKILPLGFSMLDEKTHLQFGELIKDVIMESDKRIGIIASGDLSHKLTDNAPAGYHKDGEAFDKKLIEMLETRNTAGIISMERELIENADQCGYRSILILLGVLKEMNYQFHNLSYEAPFGIGYLTGNFSF